MTETVVPFFRHMWVINFEFSQPPGENPVARVFTAIERFSGREVKLTRADLVKLRHCPFDIGRDALVCSYNIVAEISCFLTLGWELPCNVLCLFSEHRVTTNGLSLPFENNLAGALACRGAAHLSDPDYQDRMNKRAQDPTPFTALEEAEMVQHCHYNTVAALRLLDLMLSTIRWQRARFFGRYVTEVARIENRGTPLAVSAVRHMVENRETLVHKLIAAVDSHLGVYDGITFKRDRMRDLINARGWAENWPMQPDGLWPKMDKETLKMMEDLYPGAEGEEGTIADFRQLRATISQLRDIKLAVGHDGRNRTSFMPFATKTGRNAPSTTKFVWGVAKWIRRLIEPPPGMALGYLDYSAEEFLIFAVLTGDEVMADAYHASDPYMGVGIALGLARPVPPERAIRKSGR